MNFRRTYYLPRKVNMLVIFSVLICKSLFVLSTRLSMSGSNILQPPLFLGNKRVSQSISSGYLFHRKLNIVLFVSGIKSLGSYLHTKVLKVVLCFIKVFPLWERSLWFWIFFPIFSIHFLMLHLWFISVLLLKFVDSSLTLSIVFHFIKNFS